jgi:hypothetical protein
VMIHLDYAADPTLSALILICAKPLLSFE